jgi:rod shape-determining protein RodA
MAGEARWPRYTSVIIAVAMCALMAIGIAAVRVSEQAEGMGGYAARQLIFAGVGLGAFAVFAAIPYPKFGRAAYPIFGLCVGLLLVLGVARLLDHSSTLLPSIRGSHRWINLGVVNFQPSELTKLGYILLLAWYLRIGDHYRRLLGLVPPFLLTLVPMFLILIEPDLGTALLLLPTLYVMLFMAGAKLRHLLGIVAIGTVLVFLPVPQSLAGMGADERAERKANAYLAFEETVVTALPLSIMEPHQLRRIDGWLRQGRGDIDQGKGYHLRQSKIVLGSGKVVGSGDWDEADYYFSRLPDDHTDFIFSIIGGQWGFLGCLGVLLLYTLIFLFGLEIAATTYDAFGRMLALGLVGLLAAQVFINVGMTMGLTPITGMTLPFISYGGSSLVVNCAAMGLLVNVGQRRPMLLSRRPFEHREDNRPAPLRPLERKREEVRA